MKKKLLAVGIIGVLMASMLVGCSYETEETQYTDEIKNQISDMYGYPNVSNFF